MQRRRLVALAALPLAGVLLGSCAGAASDEYVIENDPGHVEFADGSEIGEVTLADGASERLGIQTTTVTEKRGGLVVPSTAIFVDPEGRWWVYTNPAQNRFVRHEVELDRQHDGLARLASGPDAGTDVVTVGVAELYGIEAEVGH